VLAVDSQFVSAFGDKSLARFENMSEMQREAQTEDRLEKMRRVMKQNGLPLTQAPDFMQAAVADMMTVSSWQLRLATKDDGYVIESLPHEKFFLLPAILLVMDDAICQFCIGRPPGVLAAMVAAASNVMVFGMDRSKWYSNEQFFTAAANQHDNLMAQGEEVESAMNTIGAAFYAFLETGAEKHQTLLGQAIRYVLDHGQSVALGD
jgi:hypothetical protein